jgi:hypothetical protein
LANTYTTLSDDEIADLEQTLLNEFQLVVTETIQDVLSGLGTLVVNSRRTEPTYDLEAEVRAATPLGEVYFIVVFAEAVEDPTVVGAAANDAIADGTIAVTVGNFTFDADTTETGEMTAGLVLVTTANPTANPTIFVGYRCFDDYALIGTADLLLLDGSTFGTNKTQAECEAECTANTACESYVYVAASGYCELWSTAIGNVPQSGITWCVAPGATTSQPTSAPTAVPTSCPSDPADQQCTRNRGDRPRTAAPRTVNAFECEPDTGIVGVADVLLSDNSAFATNFTTSDCAAECLQASGCAAYVFSASANGYCELWSTTAGTSSFANVDFCTKPVVS